MTRDYKPLKDIVDEIGRLYRSRATGTLFVATGANKSAQILFKDGDITSIYFFNRHGRDALEKMSTIKVGRYRFQKGFTPGRKRADLPDTDVIIERLTGFCGVESPPETVRSSGPGGGISEEDKSVLEKSLVEYIGPMAAIVCEDYFHGEMDLQDIVEKLALEIPSPQQAVKFREEVLKKLK
ncbi:DUF4388 domain-containing protein [Desulfomarina sp.]